MEKTVVELFAGVGGFRVGLNNVDLVNEKVIEKNNFKFIWANQWEPSTKMQDAYDCYIKRFGKKNVSNEDINLIDKNMIPNHTLLVGGFPCQDYSVAQSLSSSKGIEGKKGVLWWSINEILSIKKPPFVLLENVDRLLKSPANQRGRDFGIMLRCFFENNYSVQWRVINAADYGMAQKRRRVFIFASLNTTQYSKKLNKFNSYDIIKNEGVFSNPFPIKEKTLGENNTSIENHDVLKISNNFKFEFLNSGIMRNGTITTFKTEPEKEKPIPLKDLIIKHEIDKTYFLSSEQIEKMRYLKGAKKISRTKPNGEKYNYSEGGMSFPENLNDAARTMLTSERSINRSSHIIEDKKTKKMRFLLPVEAERINGFPDNWTDTGMTERKRYFMMGNALVIGIIIKLGKEIEQIINSE